MKIKVYYNQHLFNEYDGVVSYNETYIEIRENVAEGKWLDTAIPWCAIARLEMIDERSK